MANPQGNTQVDPGKRTQAERYAVTRRKIIDATVACIDTFGFPKTTIQKVAREAGFTVGAVQHHFPSKSELLGAVLEDGFRNVSFELEHVLFAGKGLAERVSLFIDHCWLHFKMPAFQANLHILLGMRNESPVTLDAWMQGPLAELHVQAKAFWLRIFDDIEFTDDETLEFLYFVFSAMSGITTFARIIGPNSQANLIDSSLRVLKELLFSKFLRVT
ncbi:MAG TPA: TetR/AcrR family transcriptional regulator [Halioglobus sp.]